MNNNGQYTTIQQTSKDIKLAILIGTLMQFGGCTACIGVNPKFGIGLFTIGIITVLVAKFAKWWDHE